jgi:hypothetical protein
LLSTGIDIVPVKEGKTHILSKKKSIIHNKAENSDTYSWRIVGSVSWTEDELITGRVDGVNKSFGRIAAALLYEGQRSRRWFRLLTTKISFLHSSVNIGIEGTFQIGMFAEDVIKEFVIELVVQVGEDYNSQ